METEMLSIYLFFLTIKIICTIIAGGFRLRLALFKNTDTYSNVCFFIGYCLALIGQFVTLYNSNSIAIILQGYDSTLVMFSQIIAAGIFVFFLMGTLKTYVLNRPKL